MDANALIKIADDLSLCPSSFNSELFLRMGLHPLGVL